MSNFEVEIEDDDKKCAIDRLVKLGNKFLTIAEDEKLAGATKAFALAERAFSLALKFEKELKPVFASPIITFIEGFDRPIPRPEIWELYLRFCQRHDLFPLGRNEFFSKLLLLGCSVKKVTGNYMISPPRSNILIGFKQELE